MMATSGLQQFIACQRGLADHEGDNAVRYGMSKVLDDLERFAPNLVTPTQLPPKGRWLTVPDAADAMGVSQATIRVYKRRGLVRFRQPGGTKGRLQIFVED
jgi:hypothetical protein